MRQVNVMLRDDALRETRKHGTSAFPFEAYLDDMSAFDNQVIEWHWHREIEILMLERGRVDIWVGNECIRLSPGEGVIVNSGAIHKFEGHGEGIVPNFLFIPEWIAPEDSLIYKKYVLPWTQRGPAAQYLAPDVPWQREIIGQIRALYAAAVAEADDYELEALECTLHIWRVLWKNAAPSCRENAAPRGLNLTQARLKLMIQYILDHFGEHIALADIADAAAVSVSEALRCFHEGVQSTPMAYLNGVRLGHARRLLTETENSVGVIARECGFMSAVYMDRLFKRQYGCTPRAYREKHRLSSAD